MRFREPKTNIVIVGKWNPFVFSPDWVRMHLAPQGENIHVAFPIGDPQAPVRISFGSMVLLPSSTRLEITTTDAPTSNSVDAMGTLAQQILNLLPHTPLIGLGVNLWFEETDSAETVFQYFAFSDAPRMSAEQYELKDTSIARAYGLAQDWILNLQVGYTPSTARLDFNFHRNVTSADQARAALAAHPPSTRLAEALEFTETVYDLTLEPANDPANGVNT